MKELKEMLADAAAGACVYITRVHDLFSGLPNERSDRLVVAIDLLDAAGKKAWELRVPRLDLCEGQEAGFVEEYVHAEIYNILSSIGARSMTVFVDQGRPEVLALARGLNEVFCVDEARSERRGYGRSVNVLDRMIAAVRPGEPPFRFSVGDLSQLPLAEATPSVPPSAQGAGAGGLEAFRRCTRGLEGKAFCGIDVGGTDIKAVAVDDGRIVEYEEYDWFPAGFTRSRQLVDPILLIARRLLARLRLRRADDQVLFDGIGLCFPDVVVENKIVGGEVYKTRGIRNNKLIDYEADFAELTDLDLRLKAWVKSEGKVRITNDGPMASFTAAVEIAASSEAEKIAYGVFAHTLGTELGTGWVTETGEIPEIPLEVYNFIIDLGSLPERAFESDDLRSVNNFNTGLPGTLQKYCSQSGIFRLALKYFPSERPDLFEELQDLGYVAQRAVGASKGWFVPTEPVDRRKPFLEHMMLLLDRENDETNRKIWREIGETLAVTVLETKRILEPLSDERFLFGRLVKSQSCFDALVEGGRSVKSDLTLVMAGTGMANTSLMRQLERNPDHTVAQFAQAIGAVYFVNGH